MVLTVAAAASYLREYTSRYREAYDRFTASPPNGAGYPKLAISPYLYSKEIICYLAEDGAAIADFSFPRTDRWELLGGPVLLVDEEPTHTPPAVAAVRKAAYQDRSLGIYRIVSKDEIPKPIWTGALPSPIASAKEVIPDGLIRVEQLNVCWEELIRRLTFGAFCLILDLKLPRKDYSFWTPRIIRHLGFATADMKNKRFYSYLELVRHVDDSAWDERGIWARVEADIRRDFIHGAHSPDFGAVLEFTSDKPAVVAFRSDLKRFRASIDGFKQILDQNKRGDEALFHQYLLEHSELLDLYGKPRYKPRLEYPQGDSPIGKKYVEPDFIIVYPANRYKLVELEKPSKKISTVQGQTSSGVSQAAFQIAEWKTFVQKHYEVIKKDFPGIAVHCSSMIVIGTNSAQAFGENRKPPEYMEIVKNQYNVDDVFTYDDIVNRAEAAYVRLSALV